MYHSFNFLLSLKLFEKKGGGEGSPDDQVEIVLHYLIKIITGYMLF